jgi:hypothetical protein
MWICRSLGTSVLAALMAAERSGSHASSQTSDTAEIAPTARRLNGDEAFTVDPRPSWLVPKVGACGHGVHRAHRAQGSTCCQDN